MIAGHQIAYRNVVSKYYHFNPKDLEMALDDFITILAKNHYHPTGVMLFAILSDPTNEEEMVVEIFLQIEEEEFESVTDEQIFFQSYFSIYPTVMTRVTENFNEQSQIKYWELFEYLNQNSLEQRTPVCVEYKRTPANNTYVEMSVGI